MTLAEQIVDRQPLESAGNSGNPIERVTLRDGRELVLKQVSPEWDWMSRAANDRGRLGHLWDSGFFDRVPPAIDHAMVAIETVGTRADVFMRNVARVLVAPDARLDRDGINRMLSAMYELHDAFWGERAPELCSLEDRYVMFSPATLRAERENGNRHGEVISRGWEAFPDLVSGTVATAVLALADHPAPLAEQLAQFEHTLVHGDFRLGSLGLDGDGVVLIDWGERVGSAPPAVELAWFLGFDAYRMDVTPEAVMDDFRARYSARSDETALQLALIGALVQLGGIMALWVISAPEEAQRDLYRSHLSWWDTAVADALDTWSPV